MINENNFIRDMLESEDTNENLMDRYGFKTKKEMFRKWEKIKKKHKVKIPSKCTKEELENISLALKTCLREFK